jgi:hypothetical protein
VSAATLRLPTGGPFARAAAALAHAREGRGPAVGSLLGLEHEYRVCNVRGGQVDFRCLLPGLPVSGRSVDPGDAHARRLAWGAALTADEREAEIALPPLETRPGAAALMRDLAQRARAELTALLPPAHSLTGYSTHISVAMPTLTADAVARSYARTFGPALMLLLDSAEAPGLLVRPRPGRLELGGDYREGDSLRAAVLFALGSVLAAAANRRGRAVLPVLRLEPAPAVDRYGWYVDRAAFGADLYAEGRAMALPLAGGGTVRAGELLARTWEVARRTLRGRATTGDFALVDALVEGRLPLPIEMAPAAESGPVAVPTTPAFRAPEGAILDDIVRPGFCLRATLATWEFAAFEVDGPRRAALAVPRADLGAFLTAAATGVLDRQVGAFLARPSSGSLLASRDQAIGPARMYDGIGDPRGLLAAEPGDPRATAIGVIIGAVGTAAGIAGRVRSFGPQDAFDPGGRPGKRRHDTARESRPNQTAHAAPDALSTPLVIVPIAATRPIVPIVAVGASLAIIAAIAFASGIFGARAAPIVVPTATLAAAFTAVPSAEPSSVPGTVAPSGEATPTASPEAASPVPTASAFPSASPFPSAAGSGAISPVGTWSAVAHCDRGWCKGQDFPRTVVIDSWDPATGAFTGPNIGGSVVTGTFDGSVLRTTTSSPGYKSHGIAKMSADGNSWSGTWTDSNHAGGTDKTTRLGASPTPR